MSQEPVLSSEGNPLKTRPSRARYNKVHAALESRWRRRELKAERMMREVVDELWEEFATRPYSWCGFHLLAPSGVELLLGPHRGDVPTSSCQTLEGVCGEALRGGKSLITMDYGMANSSLEQDPKGHSRIVLPVYDMQSRIWAIFEAASELPGVFDEIDQRWLERILKAFQEVGKIP
jgi:putative methionine-R-sulfoxide reductase with GAF domain